MVINQGKLQQWWLLPLHLLSSWLYDKINVVQVVVIIVIRQVCTNKLQFELHKLPSILGCNKLPNYSKFSTKYTTTFGQEETENNLLRAVKCYCFNFHPVTWCKICAPHRITVSGGNTRPRHQPPRVSISG